MDPAAAHERPDWCTTTSFRSSHLPSITKLSEKLDGAVRHQRNTCRSKPSCSEDLNLEGNLRALLKTPPPHDTPGSRKVAPKAAHGGVRVKGEVTQRRNGRRPTRS